MIYLILLLIFNITFIWIGGLSESIQDNIINKFDQTIFNTDKYNRQFWDPSVSWKNKYVEGSKLKKWWYKNTGVIVTDAWHLFKSIHTISFYLLSIISIISSLLIFDNKIYIGLFFSISFLISYLFKKYVFEVYNKKLLKQKK
jgi:hypothetical protein